MTKDEAIRILDPETTAEAFVEYEYYGGFNGKTAMVNAVSDACEAAVAALRAQQAPVKLDRSRWKGCEYCKPDVDGCSTCFKNWKGSGTATMYIPKGKAAIVVKGKHNHSACVKISFCPHCGRPLTEEAWAELERRIFCGQENS